MPRRRIHRKQSRYREGAVNCCGTKMEKSNLDSQAREILRAAGLYCTAGRVAILKVLMKAGRPLTSVATRQSGDVAFTVEAAVTEGTCGRDLAAQTIQVSPGAEPFAFDLTLAMPDCAFIGEILVMRDMILDLAVAAR